MNGDSLNGSKKKNWTVVLGLDGIRLILIPSCTVDPGDYFKVIT